MEKSYITFNVRSTSTNNALGVDVLLDNVMVYNNDSFIAEETVKVELPEDEAEHSLKIVLKNKTGKHTVLDPLGAIVQDTNLVISNICFDEIKINHNILESAIYTHDCNGTDELKEHKFYDVMGCNGTVELKFITPIYLWLLEHM